MRVCEPAGPHTVLVPEADAHTRPDCQPLEVHVGTGRVPGTGGGAGGGEGAGVRVPSAHVPSVTSPRLYTHHELQCSLSHLLCVVL